MAREEAQRQAQPPAAAPAPAVGVPFYEPPREVEDGMAEHLDPARFLEDRDPRLETYFFVPDDADEWLGAKSWFVKTLKGQGYPFNNLLQVLDLANLRSISTVFIVSRKGTRIDPVKPTQPITGRNPDGHLVHEKRNPDEYASEYGAWGGTREKPGIRCIDFWNFRGGRASGGGLKYTEFVDAITALSMPEYRPVWKDASELKGAARPNLLALRGV